jgi:hypothetical protein
MREGVADALAKMGDQAPMAQAEWKELVDQVESEAETTGFDLTWWAAWGRRKA